MSQKSLLKRDIHQTGHHDAILAVENISQAFRSGFLLSPKEVLKNISFRVPRGSIFGFLGPNGAGKTTLIHLITGIRAPSRGAVFINGYDARTVQARQSIGYLPERPYFHEHLTGEGLLRYFGTLSGMLRKDLDRRIPEVLSSVGLAQSGKIDLGKYSKGMLQRIGIAQAILHNPDLLVLDEPMSGLDPVGRKEIRELIVDLAAQGRTLFFSSHVLPDVEAICDQVAVIDRGAVRACGPISEFIAKSDGERFELIFKGNINIDEWSNLIAPDGGLTPGGGQWSHLPGELFRVVTSGAANANQILATSLKTPGLQLVSFNPIRPSLEDLFSASVGNEKIS